MDFYAIYILEAHPTDVWQMQSNVRDGVLFRTPKSDAERSNVANACWRKLGIKFPALLDGIENRVEAAYTGWPDRLYLIDRGGRVLYKSKPGPFGFHPEELAKAMQGAASVELRHPQIRNFQPQHGCTVRVQARAIALGVGAARKRRRK